jgi:hypothetical protein
VRWAALTTALTLGGCAYEWDSLRPGPDAGGTTDVGTPRDTAADTGMATDAGVDARVDGGAADTGTTDTGTTDTGTTDAPIAMDVLDVPVVIDSGPPDAGPLDTGPLDTGPRDTGPLDTGPRDTGPLDTGPRDTGPLDTGPRDTGPVDTGPRDTGPPPCVGPQCPCAPTTPAGWCAIGAACMGGTCVVGPTAGSLVITEIMNDTVAVADLGGEWFEVYNRVETPVDLRGLRVRGNGTEMFEVTGANPVVVAGRGYAVLGASGETAANGGVGVTYVYGSAAMNLSNSSDAITLVAADGSTIDTVAYPASGWPETMGRSKALRPAILDATMNDVAAAWCPGGPAFGAGDFGTPGAANVCQ